MPRQPKKAKSMAENEREDIVPTTTNGVQQRTLDARPDTIDFRDQMYVATLTEVPIEIRLSEYQEASLPILDQGKEGACAGFGLATVCNYLLRTRKVWAETVTVSPWMLYQMAQKADPHDASAGFGTSDNPDVGASCRSAMKGWNQNGVCQSAFWLKTGPCKPAANLVADARLRPLGAYFRVNHKDLIAMHAALAEVEVLYASALLHKGWYNTKADGIIPFSTEFIGGHAFAIVAFDKAGFWIQNSWGTSWGANGFGYISYDDWLENGTDVWVGRLGVPIELHKVASAVTINNSTMNVQSSSYATPELAPHIVSIGDDGFLKQNGQWSNSEDQIKEVFKTQFPTETASWGKKRLVLYAHGGLVSEDTAVDRIGWYWSNLKSRETYLIGFVWHTDYLTTLGETLRDAISQVKPEGILDSAKDFLLDRLDDTLEPIARIATGKLEWDKMKANALAATEQAKGGARIAAIAIKDYYDGLSSQDKANFELHLVGHSAGSIFLAPFIQFLTVDCGLAIESCTLWAPACTVDVFQQFYVPAAGGARTIRRFSLFTMDDTTERADNCAGIYHKSLLYLVSDAFETQIRIPLLHPDGQPLLGMEKFITQPSLLAGGSSIEQWLQQSGSEWIKSPNQQPPGSAYAAGARHHGDFSTDHAVLLATIARIAGKDAALGNIRTIGLSGSDVQSTKRAIQLQI
jgi:Papain family cysteine protease